MRVLRTAAVAVLSLALGACATSAKYRVTPGGGDARALEEARSAFIHAAETGETGAIEPQLDLEGRLRLLELGEALVTEKDEARRPGKDAMMVLAMVLGSGGESSGAFTEGELAAASARMLQDKIEEHFDLDAGDRAFLGLFLKKVKVPGEAERRTQVLDRLRDSHVSQCKPGDVELGFSAELLDEVPLPKGEAFQKWSSRLQSGHLVSVDCGSQHGLLLLTRYKDQPQPRIAAWQFFSEDQWDVVKAKLEKLKAP